ncbi:MAG TPA: flagellar export protein FliJ [Syntrophales bacterium]|nr:flagellar export protein FliJ [Syntrophales bacterium]
MFKFEFQQVLDFRKNVEERRLVEHSDQQKEVKKERLALAQLRKKKTQLTAQFLRIQEEGMQASDAAHYVSYIQHVNEKERLQQEAVVKAEAVLEEKKAALLEAVKKRKAMERLREKRLAEHRSAQAAKERRNLDEFGIRSFQRKTGNEETDHSL